MIARGRRSHRSSGFDGLEAFGEVPLSSKLDGLWLVPGPMLRTPSYDRRRRKVTRNIVERISNLTGIIP